MHELAVTAALLERVEQHAERLGAKKVMAINLVIGERASIVDDSLRFAFDLLTPGTVADGARLNVRRTSVRCHCERCGRDYAPPVGSFRCPACQAVGRVTDDGGELAIESLEFER